MGRYICTRCVTLWQSPRNFEALTGIKNEVDLTGHPYYLTGNMKLDNKWYFTALGKYIQNKQETLSVETSFSNICVELDRINKLFIVKERSGSMGYKNYGVDITESFHGYIPEKHQSNLNDDYLVVHEKIGGGRTDKLNSYLSDQYFHCIMFFCSRFLEQVAISLQEVLTGNNLGGSQGILGSLQEKLLPILSKLRDHENMKDDFYACIDNLVKHFTNLFEVMSEIGIGKTPEKLTEIGRKLYDMHPYVSEDTLKNYLKIRWRVC